MQYMLRVPEGRNAMLMCSPSNPCSLGPFFETAPSLVHALLTDVHPCCREELVCMRLELTGLFDI